MCVSKLAHKGGYHFFLLLISLMWMACGSCSEKLHVIPGWQLWAPALSPAKGHYLHSAGPCGACMAIPGLPSALGAVAVQLWGAGEVRGCSGHWHSWNTTQVTWACRMGHPCSLTSLLHAPEAPPGLSAEVLPDGRLILGPGVWHWNSSLAW